MFTVSAKSYLLHLYILFICEFDCGSQSLKMSPLQFIHLILLTITTTVFNLGYSQERGDWSYIVFTLSWPPSFCSSVKCKLPPGMNDFNIHGLWPSVWPGKQPTNCSAYIPFDSSRLQAIRSQLDTAWVNMKDYKDPTPFWEHEWYKHGQCATEDILIHNELGYFNTSLVLKEKIDLLNKLELYGIKPENSKPIDNNQFSEALKKAYNVRVLFTCTHKHRHKHNRLAKLDEVRLCFNPQLEFIDCPSHEIEENKQCPERFIFLEFNSE
ncbi:unnamed protein product [Heterobilharzia americana]|nr:unnamed protein product [Heterobilharzia americana]